MSHDESGPKELFMHSEDDVFFAFSHGIKLVAKAHGLDISDPSFMEPIFEQMKKIAAEEKRQSLVQAHDSLDMDQVMRLRTVEQLLCATYLGECAAANPEQN